MNTLKLIEYKPNFELQAMLKQISNMEIKPLKIITITRLASY